MKRIDFIFGRVKTKKFIFDSRYFYSFTYLTPVTIYCVLPNDPRMHCDLFWEKLIDRDRFLLMLGQLYSRISYFNRTVHLWNSVCRTASPSISY